jgi:hypothetical protein
MVKKWGRPWYAIGIGGTAALIAIWTITRLPGNPITGRGFGVNSNGIIVEVMEAAFIALAAATLVMESKNMKKTEAA